MKKIALAAFSATALLGLSACGDEPVAAETTAVSTMETPAPVETVVTTETTAAAE